MITAKKMNWKSISFLLLFSLLLSSIVCSASDWPPPKPKMITLATFDIGGSLYVTFSSIANAINEKFGVKVRIIPIGNAVARATVLRSGSAQMWGSCSSYLGAVEGLFEFGAMEWGPQPLHGLYYCNRQHKFSPATTKKSGIKNITDVRGKKVAWPLGEPLVTLQVEAFLAFAGLNKRDVKLVEFPGYTASTKGLISGKVDMALMGAASTNAVELDASPSGLYWIPVSHSDSEGWKRLQSVAPFVTPISLKEGAGVPKGEAIEAASYACPVLAVMEEQNIGITYWTTKMFAESFDLYKDKFLAAPFFELSEALKPEQTLPYAEGSVKYFKEQNKWTEKMEARRQYLLKRQKILKEAFEKTRDEFLDSKKKAKEFQKFWGSKRSEALKKAGMPDF